MIVQRIRLARRVVLPIMLVFVWFQSITAKKRYFFDQDIYIASCLDIIAHDKWQPEQIVRESRSHATSRWRMPPVQHIARLELITGSPQNMIVSNSRCREHQRHHILQLVAEAKCAAGLVESCPSPDTT